MSSYIFRRLLLLPLTLFCIMLVNFIIINLAPGDPTSMAKISATGEAVMDEKSAVSAVLDDPYLQFRERYGLTLPVLFNLWPNISRDKVLDNLLLLDDKENVSSLHKLKLKIGDQAPFVMKNLLSIADDLLLSGSVRENAMRFFVRGGIRQGYLGPNLSAKQKQYNKKISKENFFLMQLLPSRFDDENTIVNKLFKMNQWYSYNKQHFSQTFLQKCFIFFVETRFAQYFRRIITLDFGTIRNDSNKTVLYEVTRRFKYSLTLALIPMIVTFGLCMFFGFVMALHQNRFLDVSLNVFFLILYAVPVFVVGPFLIEKVALNHDFFFTDIPIPISGFSSPPDIYQNLTSWQRLFDIFRHICLPLLTIIYGGLAVQSRLARTAILEVLKQDYVRTARAKGLAPFTIMWKHVGRNASITMVTAIAGSLGVVLSGSLIVETIFEIDGFGRFFYEAVINRDYNVIMFSALAGAFLTLIGYLVADITYTLLDPRVTLD